MDVSLNVILAAALLPCIVLLVYIYKKDRIEKEPTGLLFKLFIFGCISTIPAMILEIVGTNILAAIGLNPESVLFILIENFLIVALAEEFCKRFMLKLGSWKDPNFNYMFDGVVYAVFVAVGFAALENVGYVMSFGIEVAPIRGLAAIPLHAICGMFMGHSYGLAKYLERVGDLPRSKAAMRTSLVVPVLIHGFYDFCASVNSEMMGYIWLVFVVIVDIIAIRAVKRYAESDLPM